MEWLHLWQKKPLIHYNNILFFYLGKLKIVKEACYWVSALTFKVASFFPAYPKCCKNVIK